MTAAQWALLAFSLVALALQLARGRAPERLAAVAFLFAMFGSPLLQGFTVNGVRWGVAILAVGLLASLVWLGLRWPRWWLLAAAGVQLLSLASYAVALLRPETAIWASVSVRNVIWFQLMVLALFGVLEARRAPYAEPASRRS